MENDDIAMQLGKLASALETRNEIDRCLYKKMAERDKRMENMIMHQQKAYHKLLWGMVLSILLLAGVNVAQLVGVFP
jgi:hypothetical protein